MTLGQFKSEFSKSLGKNWRQLRVETGQFLVNAQSQLDEVYFAVLQKWLKDEHGIGKSEQNVCMRLADGEIDEEVVGKIPPSTLQHITNENMPVMNEKYEIYSPDVGGPVKKEFKDFTPEEIKLNVGVHGVKSLSEGKSEKAKPFAQARASSFRVENGELVLTVPSLRKEVVYKITKELVKAVSGVYNKK